MTDHRGWEIRDRWPAPTPSDEALEALAGREFLRHARRVGRRRARARLAADSLLRQALEELDSAPSERVPREHRSSGS